MKSKEERKLAQATNNAKFKASMAEIKEKGAKRNAEINAKYAASKAEQLAVKERAAAEKAAIAEANALTLVEAGELRAQTATEVPAYEINATAPVHGLASVLIPGVAHMKIAAAQIKELKAMMKMTPAEQMEHRRKNPWLNQDLSGGGGGS